MRDVVLEYIKSLDTKDREELFQELHSMWCKYCYEYINGARCYCMMDD